MADDKLGADNPSRLPTPTVLSLSEFETKEEERVRKATFPGYKEDLKELKEKELLESQQKKEPKVKVTNRITKYL